MGSCVHKDQAKNEPKLTVKNHQPSSPSSIKTHCVPTYPSIEDVLREENRNLGRVVDS